jgi:hypothetical protein
MSKEMKALELELEEAVMRIARLASNAGVSYKTIAAILFEIAINWDKSVYFEEAQEHGWICT